MRPEPQTSEHAHVSLWGQWKPSNTSSLLFSLLLQLCRPQRHKGEPLCAESVHPSAAFYPLFTALRRSTLNTACLFLHSTPHWLPLYKLHTPSLCAGAKSFQLKEANASPKRIHKLQSDVRWHRRLICIVKDLSGLFPYQNMNQEDFWSFIGIENNRL